MSYIMQPAENYDDDLFYRISGIAAIPFGAIGLMRVDFGRGGTDFWVKWYYTQPQLKTASFLTELDGIIVALRSEGENPPFANRSNLAEFCASTSGSEFSFRDLRYIIQTAGYSYLFTCLSDISDYDISCAVYDNRWFLPTMAVIREIQELHN